KPHELTQQFVVGVNENQKNKHRAPWFDEELPQDRSLRLYRALEFFTTRHLSAGMGEARIWADPTQRLTGVNDVAFGSNRELHVLGGRLSGPTSTGGTWEIGRGSALIVDEGPNMEVVRVKGPAGLRESGIVADFLRPHAAGCRVTP